MIFRRVIPTLVMLAAVVVFGLLALSWVERDRHSLRNDALEQVAATEQQLAAEIEGALVAMAREVRAGTRGRQHFLYPDQRVLPFAPRELATAEDWTRVEASLANGDQLRQAGEPLRAIDAYTLAIGRCESVELRQVLLWNAAITALATDSMAAWGRVVLKELAAAPTEAQVNGLPVDLLAVLALSNAEEARAAAKETRVVTATDLLDRLDRVSVDAAAALHARFAKRSGWVEDTRLADEIAARRREAEVIAECADSLRRGEAVLTERYLLLPGVEVVAAGVDVSKLDVSKGAVSKGDVSKGDVSKTDVSKTDVFKTGGVNVGGAKGSAKAGAAEAARSEVAGEKARVLSVRIASIATALPRPTPPLRLSVTEPAAQPWVEVEGRAIASVTLFDPGLADRVAGIERRAAGLRSLSFAVIGVVAVAGLATWFAIDRQRRLAALRIRLLANVSHELKTPVTSIRMLGELLEQGKLPAERVVEFGKLITGEAERLGTRIEEILETARLERQSTPLTVMTLSLPQLVTDVVSKFRPRVSEAKGTLELSIDAGKEPLQSNRDALERIVENLLDNAIKYGSSADSSPAIWVRINGTAARLQVVVEDAGPGVPAGEGDRIFEPFYRAHYDDFAVSGTGLGLSISRSFAERLGGSLRHAARPEGGSRFTLTLPRHSSSGTTLGSDPVAMGEISNGDVARDAAGEGDR